jgi:hypothetical protein
LIKLICNINKEDIKVRECRDLSSFFVANNMEYKQFILFLKWMNLNVDEIVNRFFNNLYEYDNRLKLIIEMRANNNTLREIGEIIGVTRERVRQLEQKVHKKFVYWNGRNNILGLISVIRNNDEVLTINEITNEILMYGKEFVYFLKDCNTKEFTYDRTLGVFVLDSDEKIDRVKGYVESLPIVFNNKKYDEFIKFAESRNMSVELVSETINNVYNK